MRDNRYLYEAGVANPFRGLWNLIQRNPLQAKKIINRQEKYLRQQGEQIKEKKPPKPLTHKAPTP